MSSFDAVGGPLPPSRGPRLPPRGRWGCARPSNLDSAPVCAGAGPEAPPRGAGSASRRLACPSPSSRVAAPREAAPAESARPGPRALSPRPKSAPQTVPPGAALSIILIWSNLFWVSMARSSSPSAAISQFLLRFTTRCPCVSAGDRGPDMRFRMAEAPRGESGAGNPTTIAFYDSWHAAWAELPHAPHGNAGGLGRDGAAE